jgi:dynein heavy chain
LQLGESAVEALDDTADEVSLKLALWQGSAEFASLTESWRGCQFEALDLPAMEEAVARFHKSTWDADSICPVANILTCKSVMSKET